jgi:hypothetical protein
MEEQSVGGSQGCKEEFERSAGVRRRSRCKCEKVESNDVTRCALEIVSRANVIRKAYVLSVSFEAVVTAASLLASCALL